MTLDSAFWCEHRLVVTVDGPDGRLVTTTTRPYARVGSHVAAEVTLSHGDVPRRGLYLHAADFGVFCVRLDGEEPPTSPFRGWLRPEQAVPLGPYLVSARLADEGPPGQPPEPDWESRGSADLPYPMLAVKFRGREVAERRLKRRLTVVGRRRSSTLPILSRSVSAPHVVLFWHGGVLWAIDLLSRNGTLLDRRPIDAAQLPLGGSLTLGQVELEYADLSGRPEEQRPTAITVPELPRPLESRPEPRDVARSSGREVRGELCRQSADPCPWAQTDACPAGSSPGIEEPRGDVDFGDAGRLLPCSTFALAWARLFGEKVEHERQWAELVAQRQAMEIRFQEQLAAIGHLLVDMETRQREVQLRLEQWFAEQRALAAPARPAPQAIAYDGTPAPAQAGPVQSSPDRTDAQEGSFGLPSRLPKALAEPPVPPVTGVADGRRGANGQEPRGVEAQPQRREESGQPSDAVPPSGAAGPAAWKAHEDLNEAYDQLLRRLAALSQERSGWWGRVKETVARYFGSPPGEPKPERPDAEQGKPKAES